MIVRGFNTIYDNAGKRQPFRFSGSNVFMSGRWRRRDGDTYGIVPPQPPIVLAEPASADDPAGDLRSSAIS